MSLRILACVLSPVLGLWLGWGNAPAPKPGAAEAEAPAAKREAAGKAAPATQPEAGPAPAAAAGNAPAPADDDATIASADVLDVVLPCGLRVITAKDASLPVAAVVLAVEVGTRDDPDKLPGLVHALAYHLQQGNRELAPGEAIATAHDAGGLAAMAVGVAQVRFESLVPISSLDAQLRVESLRLRAPNTGRELWIKSLSYARNDDGVKLLVPREAIAAAWQDPGLAHDGRQVGRALGDMLDQSVGAQLSRLYDYRAATLVVVGPDEPQALLARVEPLFAGLPARPRKPIASTAAPALTTPAPATINIPKQRGDSMLWAVPGDPRSRAWAQVMCGTINRQGRGVDDPPKARVRCTYDDDPRRPILVLRASAFDPATGPEPLIAARLDRIAALATDAKLEPDLAVLIEGQRQRIETDLRFKLRTPAELAGYLASAAERQTAGVDPRALDEILGLPLAAASTTPSPTPEAAPEPVDAQPPGGEPADETAPPPDTAAALVAAIPSLLDTRRAVLLLDAEQPAPPPLHPAPAAPGPAPGPDPATASPDPATASPGPASPDPATTSPGPATTEGE